MNKKNKIDLSPLSENTVVEDLGITEEMRVYGWESARQAADEVYSSLHKSLIEGKLIFAYKGATTANFYQIVITQDIDQFTGELKDTFSVGITTHGFSALLPHVPLSYLEEDIPKDLSNYKIDKDIINVYQRIINELKNV